MTNGSLFIIFYFAALFVFGVVALIRIVILMRKINKEFKRSEKVGESYMTINRENKPPPTNPPPPGSGNGKKL